MQKMPRTNLPRTNLPPGAKNISYHLTVDDVLFSKETADLIVTRMMDGMYLGRILKSLSLNMSTIRKWEKQSPDFAEALADARKTQAYMLVEETLEDVNAPLETMPEVTQLKVKTEVKRWVAEKYNREQFAQKVDMQLGVSLADVMDSISPSDSDTELPVTTQDVTEPIDAESTPVVISEQVEPDGKLKELPHAERNSGL